MVWEPWLAALIIGVGVLALGLILIFIGKRRLSADSLVPQRTLRTLRDDGIWLRERLR